MFAVTVAEAMHLASADLPGERADQPEASLYAWAYGYLTGREGLAAREYLFSEPWSLDYSRGYHHGWRSQRKIAKRVSVHQARRAFANGESVLVDDLGRREQIEVTANTQTHSRETTTWETLTAQVREWRGRYPGQRFYVVES